MLHPRVEIYIKLIISRPRSYTHPIYADWKDTDKYDNMHPHDNRLKEINVEPKKKQPTPRTTDEDFSIKEETPEKKRKHDEITRMQILHRQPVVDSARAVDMDEIHFDQQPFMGFNYAANTNNTRWGPHHHNAFHPPNHPVSGGRTFYGETSMYGDQMRQPAGPPQSLSGDTLVSGSFVPGSYGIAHPPPHNDSESFFAGFFDTAHPSHLDGAEPFVTGAFDAGGADPYASSSFGAVGSAHGSGTEAFFPGSFEDAEPTYPNGNHASAFGPFAAGSDGDVFVDGHHEEGKQEDTQEYRVSATPADDSDFAWSDDDDERPRKAPKLNKDGVPRKPRQPRAKLLKWSDDDWKNVCLGIVWACGETGVQIPFDQAAQVVGEKCTAGALQQALLKLRGKQVDAGHSIPNLKMAWTRKNKPATPGKTKASVEPEANKQRKKPTRFEATQSLIVTLPRAYTAEDREGLQAPYKWRKLPRNAKAKTKREQTQAGGGQYSAGLPATPPRASYLYDTPPVTPFGHNTGYLQGMVLGSGEYASLLTTEGLHEVGNGWGDAVDDVFGV